MELNLETIGKNVLLARTAKGFTQDGLAKAIGKTQSCIQKIEQGETDINITIINKLSESLQVSPMNLLFSSPQTVFNFNNCLQSGNHNHYVVNGDEISNMLKELIAIMKNK